MDRNVVEELPKFRNEPNISSYRPRHCPTCLQQFSRNEHLQRHQLTHHENGVRPFRCKTCLETFARSDVLKRHETTQHPQGTDPGSGRQDLSLRKTRTAVACDRCAKAKIRCNGMLPCDRCQSRRLTCALARPHNVLKRRLPSAQAANSFPASVIAGHGIRNVSASEQEQFEFQKSPVLATPSTSQDLSTSSIDYRRNDALQLPASYGGHPSARFLASPPDAGSATSGNVAIQTIAEELSHESFDFDFQESALRYPHRGTSAAFDAMSPSAGFSFPDDLWFQGPSPSYSNVPATEPSPSTDRSRLPPPATKAASPYANCPLFRALEDDGKKSATTLMVLICSFLKNRTSWKQIQETSTKQFSNDVRAIPLISEQTRDALVAITHIMLSKHLESACIRTMPLTFPPLQTVQCLFRSCLARFARLYPIIHSETFRTCTEIELEGVSFPIFLQNIMILGAMLLPVEEGQAFATEFAYLVRNAMHDTIAQDVLITDDVWMLSSAILITAFGAWSGNKIHIELGESHRGSYTTMFNRRGYLKPGRSVQSHDETMTEWQKWIDRERKRRLCHIWYIVEQEISFFDCITSHISFTDMRAPMPGPDDEYFAETEAEWQAVRKAQQRVAKEKVKIRPPSLAALYWLFMRDDFMHLEVDINPLHLRLLQCAIQTQVLQHSQTARFVNVEDAFPDMPSGTSIYSRSMTTSQLRFEELQNMLVKWYILSRRLMSSTYCSEIAVACYLMHHLISMELYICFDDVQCLAGKDGLEVGQVLLPQFQRWAQSSLSLKAIAHAGQVIRIFQASYPCENYEYKRPLWWPVALTRATLVLWSYAISNRVTDREQAREGTSSTSKLRLISLNDMSDDAGPYGKVIQLEEGVPCLTNTAGTLVPIHQMSDILDMVLIILEDGKSRSTPLCESIIQFLRDIQRYGVPY